MNLCLNYHDFKGTKVIGSNSKYTNDFAEFRKQLDILSEYKVVNTSDLIGMSENNRHTISLNFDDGYKSNIYVAEELAKRELSATFFIITERCGKDNNYMSTKDVKELVDMGMVIGSHSCTHRHLNRLPEDELIRELRESKNMLENLISKSVEIISFPGGQCGKREFLSARNEGYLLNRSTITGINKLPLKNDIIKCINIKSNISLSQFEEICTFSDTFFLKQKLREYALIFPKYFSSIMKDIKRN